MNGTVESLVLRQPWLDLPGVDDGSRKDQMKLRLVQLLNWGTFDGWLAIKVAADGQLMLGPSGSGKSTILDAHAAILTPPKWTSFNVAAREGEQGRRDRSYVTYVRGAWSKQTTDSGEIALQYLRRDTTWSAIAETYEDGHGKTVTLAQVFWIKGKSTDPKSLSRFYIVVERKLDLKTELAFLPKNEFDVRRFKFDMSDAFVKDDFTPYFERFKRLLGIESLGALRLLHKTQAAKNVGELNDFMREYMLDPPETFELADKLVAQFVELNDAHRAVVTARKQIETLLPAKAASDELTLEIMRKGEVDVLLLGIDKYREQRRKRLLDEAVVEGEAKLAGLNQELERLEGMARNAHALLRSLQGQLSGMGGGLLADLAGQLEAKDEERNTRFNKRVIVRAACLAMGWTVPDKPEPYAELQSAAANFLRESGAIKEHEDNALFELRSDLAEVIKQIEAVEQELESLREQPSNIESAMLVLRRQIASALNIPESKLPFVGELIEVKPDDQAWAGAIERVLRGFALSMLVDDRYYADFAAYVDDNDLRRRLVYQRTLGQGSTHRTIGPNSIYRKLNFGDTRPQTAWVREELKAHFDYECAETIQSFRAAPRAVTMQGQVKHNSTRHEKNDGSNINDRGRWVLGFDNAQKREHYMQQLGLLEARRTALTNKITEHRNRDKARDEKLKAATTVLNTAWSEIDVQRSIEDAKTLEQRIAREKEARPNLATLEADIAAQLTATEKADAASRKQKLEVDKKGDEIATLNRKISEIRPELLALALDPSQVAGLDQRFAATEKLITWETIQNISHQVTLKLRDERDEHEEICKELRDSICKRFDAFIREWKAEAGGLDATMASKDDFLAKLARLQDDGLPKFEQRFLELLREQTYQNLTMLQTQLLEERKAIRDRLDLVNASLRTAPYSKGTHLQIDPKDRSNKDVDEFKANLKACLANMLSTDPAQAEQRFVFIQQLVGRLGSQEPAERRWRDVVLDVRKHIDFLAREIDDLGATVDVSSSGDGKSGGQRQKLAATCLAAALRYQLGGEDRALPRFSTVFMDEAFDKADSEFTRLAMGIFKLFGFQMVVATPLKSVMTLEAFVGGATFVSNPNRNSSSIIDIEYDVEDKRLLFPKGLPHAEEA